MARTMNYKKPKDTKKTLKRLLGYLGVHKIAVAIVAILVTVSSVASILGTYLLKPVVNRYILPGDVEGLARMLFFMGVMLCGRSTCNLWLWTDYGAYGTAGGK